MKNRQTVTITRQLYDDLRNLNKPQDRADMVLLILDYSFTGKEPDMEGHSEAVQFGFSLIFPKLKADFEKFKNGCVPKKSKSEAKKKPIESKRKAKQEQKKRAGDCLVTAQEAYNHKIKNNLKWFEVKAWICKESAKDDSHAPEKKQKLIKVGAKKGGVNIEIDLPFEFKIFREAKEIEKNLIPKKCKKN